MVLDEQKNPLLDSVRKVLDPTLHRENLERVMEEIKKNLSGMMIQRDLISNRPKMEDEPDDAAEQKVETVKQYDNAMSNALWQLGHIEDEMRKYTALEDKVLDMQEYKVNRKNKRLRDKELKERMKQDKKESVPSEGPLMSNE